MRVERMMESNITSTVRGTGDSVPVDFLIFIPIWTI